MIKERQQTRVRRTDERVTRGTSASLGISINVNRDDSLVRVINADNAQHEAIDSIYDPLPVKKKRADQSRQQGIDDGALNLTGDGVIIPPEYSFGLLNKIFNWSNMLRQCVNAMVTNIAGYGYNVVPIEKGREPKKAEVELLQSWIERANVDHSMMQIARKQIFEYEKYGFRMLEVIRSRGKEPTLLRHVPIASMSILSRQRDAVKVTTEVVRGKKRVEVTEYKKFRKYVQRLGATMTYFKEYGDKRDMDYTTGEYWSTGKARIPENKLATEIMHNKQESEDLYGIPRWINQIPSILGSREAETVNYRYFQDNTIPPSIITVSGGRLTRESFMEIKRVLSLGGIGRQNQLMLLEAIPESEGLDANAQTAKVAVEKLADQRPSDGLFGKYDEANMAKIRSAFRLPPVILGMSQDVTFATANVSAYLAEMQVFHPERMYHDEWLNNSFVNHDQGLGLTTCKLESRAPSLTDPDRLIKALQAGNQMGAVTPRSAIKILSDNLQIDLTQYPEEGEEGWEEWMDKPMTISAKEAGAPGDTGVDQTHAESQAAAGGAEDNPTNDNTVVPIDGGKRSRK